MDTLFRKVAIKGQFFLTDPASKAAVASVNEGDDITLEPEPENQHDQHAVAALRSGTRVGYLQQEVSPAIAWFLHNGFTVQCVVMEISKNKNFLVNINVEAP